MDVEFNKNVELRNLNTEKLLLTKRAGNIS